MKYSLQEAMKELRTSESKNRLVKTNIQPQIKEDIQKNKYFKFSDSDSLSVGYELDPELRRYDEHKGGISLTELLTNDSEFKSKFEQNLCDFILNLINSEQYDMFMDELKHRVIGNVFYDTLSKDENMQERIYNDLVSKAESEKQQYDE